LIIAASPCEFCAIPGNADRAGKKFNMLLFDEVRIEICQWLAVVCPQSPNELEQVFVELEAFMRECTARGQMHPPKARLEYRQAPHQAGRQLSER